MSEDGSNGEKKRKRKVYLPEELKHEVARKAKRSRDLPKLAERYGVSPTTVRSWLRNGYGTEPPPSKEPASARSLEDLLMLAIRAALKEDAITHDEAVQLMSLAVS